MGKPASTPDTGLDKCTAQGVLETGLEGRGLGLSVQAAGGFRPWASVS